MTCMICGKDCSFISFTEDVCLGCGDALQLLGAGELTLRLVAAQKEVNRLETELAKYVQAGGVS